MAEGKLAHIQVAEVGHFKGHAAGPFELTPKVFDEILASFDLQVPIDAEHASEMPATEGSIPVTGAPAFGWIKKLYNKGLAGLWADVEWLPIAVDYIKGGRYKYLSPAIRFNTKNRVTGQPAGARLTSCALTNAPFLRSMAPLTASDKRAAEVLVRMSDAEVAAYRAGSSKETHSMSFQMKGGAKALLAAMATDELVTMAGKAGKAFAHKPTEYMPALKTALGVHALSTLDECEEYLERLRTLVLASDDATKTTLCKPLRDLVDAQSTDTADDVFEVAEALLAAADESQVTLTETKTTPAAESVPAPTPATENTNMALTAEETKLLTDSKDKAASLGAEVVTLTADKAALTTEKASLTLRVKELEGDLKTKDEELVSLRDAASKRAEADLSARVEEAFSTYKDVKHLTDADKESLLILARANMAAFDKSYPKVEANQLHLQRELVKPEVKAKPGDVAPMTLSAMTKKLMTERKMAFSDAQIEASRLLAS